MSTYIPEPEGLLGHCLVTSSYFPRPTCGEDSHNVALTAALDHLRKPGQHPLAPLRWVSPNYLMGIFDFIATRHPNSDKL